MMISGLRELPWRALWMVARENVALHRRVIELEARERQQGARISELKVALGLAVREPEGEAQ